MFLLIISMLLLWKVNDKQAQALVQLFFAKTGPLQKVGVIEHLWGPRFSVCAHYCVRMEKLESPKSPNLGL